MYGLFTPNKQTPTPVLTRQPHMLTEEETIWVYCVPMCGVSSYGCHYLKLDFPYENGQLQCPWSYFKYAGCYLICVPKQLIQERLKQRKSNVHFYLFPVHWNQIRFYFYSPQHVFLVHSFIEDDDPQFVTDGVVQIDT